MNADVTAYHLEELVVARSPGDPRHIMPIIADDHQRILDVGCGAGQTLIASDRLSGRTACGIDVDFSALQLGKSLSGHIHFLCASGEALPFATGYFDLVISRVALPYMHIARAVSEFARVTRPGGAVWLVLHPPRMSLRKLGSSLNHFNVHAAVRNAYVLANTLAFHLSGKEFRFPFGHRDYESCQTTRGMNRTLAQAGYGDITLRRDNFFVATAQRRQSRSRSHRARVTRGTDRNRAE